MNAPQLMSIGTVADRTGLSLRTLRHYDNVGLVRPSARSDGGFRLYTEADIDRLITIRRMKPLGFTLDEMRDLLAAMDTVNNPNTNDTERAAATDYIRVCHQQAEESCQTLQRQLGYAQELTTILAGLADGPSTRDGEA